MKKILLSFAVLTIGAAAYFGINTVSASNASLMMQNVEALASGEGSSGRAICYSAYIDFESSRILECGTCRYVAGAPSHRGGYCRW